MELANTKSERRTSRRLVIKLRGTGNARRRRTVLVQPLRRPGYHSLAEYVFSVKENLVFVVVLLLLRVEDDVFF